MDISTLLAAVRRRLRDVTGYPSERLWDDDELIDEYANAARDKLFAMARRLIVDSSTGTDATGAPLCTLHVIGGTASYPISTKILETVRVKLGSQTLPLQMVMAAQLDQRCLNWENADPGVPWGYCPDLGTDSIRLIPTPAVNDTAYLTVYRLPLVRLTVEDTTIPIGIREEYHEDLIPWILHLAFLKKDAETDRPDLAEYYKTKFLERAEEIRMETFRRLSGPHTITPRRAFLSR